MVKFYIKNMIKSFLKEYVVDINKDDIDLCIGSGTLQLRNVKINTKSSIFATIYDICGIESKYIVAESLKATFSPSNFLSKPISLNISGLKVLLHADSESFCSEETVTRVIKAVRESYIKQNEKKDKKMRTMLNYYIKKVKFILEDIQIIFITENNFLTSIDKREINISFSNENGTNINMIDKLKVSAEERRKFVDKNLMDDSQRAIIGTHSDNFIEDILDNEKVNYEGQGEKSGIISHANTIKNPKSILDDKDAIGSLQKNQYISKNELKPLEKVNDSEFNLETAKIEYGFIDKNHLTTSQSDFNSKNQKIDYKEAESMNIEQGFTKVSETKAVILDKSFNQEEYFFNLFSKSKDFIRKHEGFLITVKKVWMEDTSAEKKCIYVENVFVNEYINNFNIVSYDFTLNLHIASCNTIIFKGRLSEFKMNLSENVLKNLFYVYNFSINFYNLKNFLKKNIFKIHFTEQILSIYSNRGNAYKNWQSLLFLLQKNLKTIDCCNLISIYQEIEKYSRSKGNISQNNNEDLLEISNFESRYSLNVCFLGQDYVKKKDSMSSFSRFFFWSSAKDSDVNELDTKSAEEETKVDNIKIKMKLKIGTFMCVIKNKDKIFEFLFEDLCVSFKTDPFKFLFTLFEARIRHDGIFLFKNTDFKQLLRFKFTEDHIVFHLSKFETYNIHNIFDLFYSVYSHEICGYIQTIEEVNENKFKKIIEKASEKIIEVKIEPTKNQILDIIFLSEDIHLTGKGKNIFCKIDNIICERILNYFDYIKEPKEHVDSNNKSNNTSSKSIHLHNNSTSSSFFEKSIFNDTRNKILGEDTTVNTAENLKPIIPPTSDVVSCDALSNKTSINSKVEELNAFNIILENPKTKIIQSTSNVVSCDIFNNEENNQIFVNEEHIVLIRKTLFEFPNFIFMSKMFPERIKFELKMKEIKFLIFEFSEIIFKNLLFKEFTFFGKETIKFIRKIIILREEIKIKEKMKYSYDLNFEQITFLEKEFDVYKLNILKEEDFILKIDNLEMKKINLREFQLNFNDKIIIEKLLVQIDLKDPNIDHVLEIYKRFSYISSQLKAIFANESDSKKINEDMYNDKDVRIGQNELFGENEHLKDNERDNLNRDSTNIDREDASEKESNFNENSSVIERKKSVLGTCKNTTDYNKHPNNTMIDVSFDKDIDPVVKNITDYNKLSNNTVIDASFDVDVDPVGKNITDLSNNHEDENHNIPFNYDEVLNQFHEKLNLSKEQSEESKLIIKDIQLELLLNKNKLIVKSKEFNKKQLNDCELRLNESVALIQNVSFVNKEILINNSYIDLETKDLIILDLIIEVLTKNNFLPLNNTPRTNEVIVKINNSNLIIFNTIAQAYSFGESKKLDLIFPLNHMLIEINIKLYPIKEKVYRYIKERLKKDINIDSIHSLDETKEADVSFIKTNSSSQDNYTNTIRTSYSMNTSKDLTDPNIGKRTSSIRTASEDTGYYFNRTRTSSTMNTSKDLTDHNIGKRTSSIRTASEDTGLHFNRTRTSSTMNTSSTNSTVNSEKSSINYTTAHQKKEYCLKKCLSYNFLRLMNREKILSCMDINVKLIKDTSCLRGQIFHEIITDEIFYTYTINTFLMIIDIIGMFTDNLFIPSLESSPLNLETTGKLTLLNSFNKETIIKLREVDTDIKIKTTILLKELKTIANEYTFLYNNLNIKLISNKSIMKQIKNEEISNIYRGNHIQVKLNKIKLADEGKNENLLLERTRIEVFKTTYGFYLKVISDFMNTNIPLSKLLILKSLYMQPKISYNIQSTALDIHVEVFLKLIVYENLILKDFKLENNVSSSILAGIFENEFKQIRFYEKENTICCNAPKQNVFNKNKDSNNQTVHIQNVFNKQEKGQNENQPYYSLLKEQENVQNLANEQVNTGDHNAINKLKDCATDQINNIEIIYDTSSKVVSLKDHINHLEQGSCIQIQTDVYCEYSILNIYINSMTLSFNEIPQNLGIQLIKYYNEINIVKTSVYIDTNFIQKINFGLNNMQLKLYKAINFKIFDLFLRNYIEEDIKSILDINFPYKGSFEIEASAHKQFLLEKSLFEFHIINGQFKCESLNIIRSLITKENLNLIMAKYIKINNLTDLDLNFKINNKIIQPNNKKTEINGYINDLSLLYNNLQYPLDLKKDFFKIDDLKPAIYIERTFFIDTIIYKVFYEIYFRNLCDLQITAILGDSLLKRDNYKEKIEIQKDSEKSIQFKYLEDKINNKEYENFQHCKSVDNLNLEFHKMEIKTNNNETNNDTYIIEENNNSFTSDDLNNHQCKKFDSTNSSSNDTCPFPVNKPGLNATIAYDPTKNIENNRSSSIHGFENTSKDKMPNTNLNLKDNRSYPIEKSDCVYGSRNTSNYKVHNTNLNLKDNRSYLIKKSDCVHGSENTSNEKVPNMNLNFKDNKSYPIEKSEHITNTLQNQKSNFDESLKNNSNKNNKPEKNRVGSDSDIKNNKWGMKTLNLQNRENNSQNLKKIYCKLLIKGFIDNPDYIEIKELKEKRLKDEIVSTKKYNFYFFNEKYTKILNCELICYNKQGNYIYFIVIYPDFYVYNLTNIIFNFSAFNNTIKYSEEFSVKENATFANKNNQCEVHNENENDSKVINEREKNQNEIIKNSGNNKTNKKTQLEKNMKKNSEEHNSNIKKKQDCPFKKIEKHNHIDQTLRVIKKHLEITDETNESTDFDSLPHYMLAISTNSQDVNLSYKDNNNVNKIINIKKPEKNDMKCIFGENKIYGIKYTQKYIKLFDEKHFIDMNLIVLHSYFILINNLSYPIFIDQRKYIPGTHHTKLKLHESKVSVNEVYKLKNEFNFNTIAISRIYKFSKSHLTEKDHSLYKLKHIFNGITHIKAEEFLKVKGYILPEEFNSSNFYYTNNTTTPNILNVSVEMANGKGMHDNTKILEFETANRLENQTKYDFIIIVNGMIIELNKGIVSDIHFGDEDAFYVYFNNGFGFETYSPPLKKENKKNADCIEDLYHVNDKELKSLKVWNRQYSYFQTSNKILRSDLLDDCKYALKGFYVKLEGIQKRYFFLSQCENILFKAIINFSGKRRFIKIYESNSWPLIIKNNTNHIIFFNQAEIKKKHTVFQGMKYKLTFEHCKSVEFNFDLLNKKFDFNCNNSHLERGAYTINKYTDKNGIIICISNKNINSESSSLKEVERGMENFFTFGITLPMVAMSFYNKNEIAALHLKDIKFVFTHQTSENERFMEMVLNIFSLQLDDQNIHSKMPVMIYSRSACFNFLKEKSKKNENLDFLKMGIELSYPINNGIELNCTAKDDSTYNKMLEMSQNTYKEDYSEKQSNQNNMLYNHTPNHSNISQDTTTNTITLKNQFEIKKFSFLMQAFNLSIAESTYLSLYNFITPINNTDIVLQCSSCAKYSCQCIKKKNVEGKLIKAHDITIHPLSFYFSLRKSTTQKNLKNLFISYIANNITDLHIKLKGQYLQQMENPLENAVYVISENYRSYILQQMFKVLGSLDVLGNISSLTDSFSTGIKDFFYEPYLVLVGEKPMMITDGIYKGSKSLVKNTLKGITGSFSKVTSSIGKGLSAASFDKDFQKSQQNYKNEYINDVQILIPNVLLMEKGFGNSVTYGTDRFIEGFVSGVKGIYSHPKEGSKKGFAGLVKGIGKGAVGLVTKPIAGMADMASGIAEGINKEIDKNNVYRLQYPRFNMNQKFNYSQSTCYYIYNRFLEDENNAFYDGLTYKEGHLVITKMYIAWISKESIEKYTYDQVFLEEKKIYLNDTVLVLTESVYNSLLERFHTKRSKSIY